MLDRDTRTATGDDGYVAFVEAGQAGKGSY